MYSSCIIPANLHLGTHYRTQVSKRPWTHWYALPFIDYGDALQSAPVHTPDTPATEHTLGSRSLEKGAKGTDVKTLQELLLQLGFSLPKYGADGSFGAETLSALKAFQSRAGIKADGIYGTETHAALMAATADWDEALKPSAPEMARIRPPVSRSRSPASAVRSTSASASKANHKDKRVETADSLKSATTRLKTPSAPLSLDGRGGSLLIRPRVRRRVRLSIRSWKRQKPASG